ncbi:hypothetical protein UlMin_037989 [Ulmus minor]
MTKRSFPSKGHRANDLLELIHSDVCGPLKVQARGGYEYFGYALETTIYLINRIPSKSIPKTPFELWTGHKSNMSPKTSKEFDSMRKIPYASAVGSLMYAMLCIRLDIYYSVGIVTSSRMRGIHNYVKRRLMSKGFGSLLFKAVANYIYNMQLLIFVFEPDIKGDSPEKVEYIGMKILINAVKGSVGLQNGKLLFGFEDNNYLELLCGAFDDIVMGGVHESIFQIARADGVVSTENNSGFASIKTKDLSAYDGFELHLKGDGRRYKLVVRLPFSSLKPIFRARSVSDAPPFDPTNVVSLQLMFSKYEYDGKLNPTFLEGPFQLSVLSNWAYLKDPISPRFVYVGSAGVTWLDKPRLDLSKQTLVVRLNKELGYILTFKLKGEELIRESGIPYAIVRLYVLTEEPAGVDLIFDQGDNITGKISRKEVACICIAALASPYALDKTFDVKSVIPFSEPFTVDPENLPPEKDYNIYFKNLKDGITGK